MSIKLDEPRHLSDVPTDLDEEGFRPPAEDCLPVRQRVVKVAKEKGHDPFSPACREGGATVTVRHQIYGDETGFSDRHRYNDTPRPRRVTLATAGGSIIREFCAKQNVRDTQRTSFFEKIASTSSPR